MRRAAVAALLALALGGAGAAGAGADHGSTAGSTGPSTGYCDDPPALTAAQQSRVLRFAAAVKQALDGSDSEVALVARSGLDLDRFDVRYSHAGLSLRDGLATPWAVRQLYFACDERGPRLYDQGLAAFLLGMDEPARGYLSVLLLPRAIGAAVARSARDDGAALRLLGDGYSANAYAYGLRYQNCNQWVAELLGSALATRGDGGRANAQAWLRRAGYVPHVFEVGWPLMLFSTWLPFIHRDDHPAEDLQAARYRVSMPDSLQALLLRVAPDAQRLEFCRTETHVLMRRDGAPIGDGCVPAPGDEVLSLE